jgi:peroxiredoxin
LAAYRDHAHEFVALGATVVALSVDPPATSRAFKERERLPFVLLCDPHKEVITAWGALNTAERGSSKKGACARMTAGRAADGRRAIVASPGRPPGWC